MLQNECAKYRTKKESPTREARADSLSHKEDDSLSNDLPNSGKVFEPSERFEVFSKKDPSYYTKEQSIRRKAKMIFHSSQGYTVEQSMKMANDEISRQRRESEQRRKQKLRSLGIKRKQYRRPDYYRKETTISRKVVQILGEKNEINNYDHARKAAEKWYRDSRRISTANLRKKQRLRKAIEAHKPNNREDVSLQNTSSSKD